VYGYSLDNTLNASYGSGGALYQKGIVPFVTSPAPTTGTYWAGTFTSGATFLSTTAAVNSWLAGRTDYTIVIRNVRMPAIGGGNAELWTLNTAGFVMDTQTATQVFRWLTNSSVISSAALGFLVDTNYDIVCSCSGGNVRKLTVGGVTVTDAGNCAMPATITTQWWGGFQGGGNGWKGYVSGIEYYDSALAYPVTASCAGTQDRAMDLQNGMRMNLCCGGI
jgi:hypothetical protein